MSAATAESERLILAHLPEVRACVVVSARIEGRVATDVLLMLHPDADPDRDYEPAIRAVLPGELSATIRRVMTSEAAMATPRLREHQLLELVGARIPGNGAGADPAPIPTEQVRVPFAGEDEGEDEISWGHREIWQSMTRQGNWLPLGGWKPLPSGTTVEDVADELAYLHSRFPSMRTTFRFDENWHPRQRLHARGETVLEVFDAPDDTAECADALAESVEALYQHRPYDLREEWPIRMAAVRRNGRAVRMVVLMHHMAVDGGGAEVMIRDAAVRTTAALTALSPLEQARWQASPAGKTQNQRALRYFESLLRTIPVPRFPVSPDPRRPRWWGLEYESPALRQALPVVSGRIGADPTHVLLAFYAVALARVTGVNPVVLRPVIGNRFRPGLAASVSNVANAGLLAVDVAGATVEQVVERARRAVVNALKHGYHDPEQLGRLIDRVAAERGGDLDIKSFFNDRRADRSMAGREAAATPEQLAALEAALGAGRLRWTTRRNVPVERLFIQIEDVPDAVKLGIEADTRALAPHQIEELARNVEQEAVRAVLEPGDRIVFAV